jgi:hypothetical protein
VNGRTDDVATVTAADVRGWLVSLQGKVAPSTEYSTTPGSQVCPIIGRSRMP